MPSTYHDPAQHGRGGGKALSDLRSNWKLVVSVSA